MVDVAGAALGVTLALNVIVAIVVAVVVVIATRKALGRAAAIERIDPFTLTDPWRSFVQDAQSASTRFARVISDVEPGPLQVRLADVNRRINEGVTAAWRIAQRGYELHKTLLEVGVDSESESVLRMRRKDAETRDQLAGLVKKLDDSVARAAEIATGQTEDLDAIASGVDNAVTELEAMRQALAEIDKT